MEKFDWKLFLDLDAGKDIMSDEGACEERKLDLFLSLILNLISVDVHGPKSRACFRVKPVSVLCTKCFFFLSNEIEGSKNTRDVISTKNNSLIITDFQIFPLHLVVYVSFMFFHFHFSLILFYSPYTSKNKLNDFPFSSHLS